METPQDIGVWRAVNYPKYGLLRQGWQNSTTEFEYIRNKYYGAQFGKITAKLDQAQDSGKYQAGFVAAPCYTIGSH